ncbi:MAG TPA: FAD/NAD(P)-binding protein [Gammaproteobacteria bacterium]
MLNPYLPCEATIIERIQESPTLFTLRLGFTDPRVQSHYQFQPGQFNMLYLYGVGEVPISIVSDPQDEHLLDHTIRTVGRVTKGIARLKAGDRLGVRGPFGRGWPLLKAEQKDVVVVTGGLGCAPVVSVINYMMRRRERFGLVNIVQGVKHSSDFIWKERYDQWRQAPATQVLVAADAGGPLWPWHVGPVNGLFDDLKFDKDRVIVMMCGPEGMMRVVVKHMLGKGVDEGALWLSMERNMHCGIGHCGHCQYGGKFICRDGPVFCYQDIKDLFGVKGF